MPGCLLQCDVASLGELHESTVEALAKISEAPLEASDRYEVHVDGTGGAKIVEDQYGPAAWAFNIIQAKVCKEISLVFPNVQFALTLRPLRPEDLRLRQPQRRLRVLFRLHQHNQDVP